MMTGLELKDLRGSIGRAVLGRMLSFEETARLCGLASPSTNGADTIRKWQEGQGPSGPVAALLGMFAVVADENTGTAIREAMMTAIRKVLR